MQNDEVIEWAGGANCPVDAHRYVDLAHRNGNFSYHVKAGDVLNWDHSQVKGAEGGELDIVRIRVYPENAPF